MLQHFLEVQKELEAGTSSSPETWKTQQRLMKNISNFNGMKTHARMYKSKPECLHSPPVVSICFKA